MEQRHSSVRFIGLETGGPIRPYEGTLGELKSKAISAMGAAAQELSSDAGDAECDAFMATMKQRRDAMQAGKHSDYDESCVIDVVLRDGKARPLDWGKIQSKATLYEPESDEESLTPSEADLVTSHRAEKRAKRT